jgi:hypothetical protein
VLSIFVMLEESYDESTQRFIVTQGTELEFEHSLVSLSKWEAKFKKPFLSREEKTTEETLFYIEHCMLLTKNPPGEILQKLFSTPVYMDMLQEYVNGKHSATTFRDDRKRPGSRQIITKAVIYGWMVGLQIPFQPTETWHLDEVFDLIRVCNEQKNPPKKMNRNDALREQARLNAQRQAAMGTRG